MQLRDLIIHQIQESGPITFRDFMDIALYHPFLGYYTSKDHRIGKRGDFFTSPYISAAFGAMIARQIEELWQQMPKNYTIVEFGAGSGLLGYDILQYLKKSPDCYDSIRYVMVEKSSVLRKLSQLYLRDKLIWIDNIKELGEFEGFVISNELFDNFPVHRVLQEDGQLMEICVDHQGSFKEVLRTASQKLFHYARSINSTIPDGVSTEICMELDDWFQDLSKYFKSGFIISIDYGYLIDKNHKYRGGRATVRSYKDHRPTHNFYEDPGQQDITADVNFSALICSGLKHGFDCKGFVNQHCFLKALGIVPFLSGMNDSEENKKYAYSVLLDQMGTSFKVLIQQKNVPPLKLRGLTLEHPATKILR